ncbi:uncharacterized protein LOC125756465 [Rhipicephalus sanguineus]|uniref:uncharacterized protein LOC125756465 n=1 Tax=Rhipicephalus sanguineus TaxID=34632 RepID=UPI0020C49EA7|nr:uncharacterized protein LOC125756465 [Rhipicephalus sanguineus]
MSVSAYHAMLLCAALTAVTSFEEKDIRCRHRDVLVPSFKICDGSPDCREIPRYSIHYGHYGDPEDEDRETCAPRHLLERTPQFTSLSHANGSLQFSWTWSIPPSSGLAGYYLSGTSPDHTFQTTLSPLLDRYTPGCLRGYTHYNITLRPFYVIDGLPKVGKATRLMVRSPSTDPGTPADIVRQSQSETTQDNAGELAVTIFEPTSWNSKPVGYRLRWEPNEQSSEPAKDFDLPVDAPDRKKDLNVTLPLKPGREYTLFARARGVGDFGEDLVGPETSVTMETAPVAPANLKAQTIDPTSAIISWHAASPVRRFVISRSFYATVKIPVPTSRVCDDDEDYYRACNDQPVHSDYREELRLETSTVILDGSTQESTSYSLPLLNLSSSAQHTVEVKACGATVCSSEATTVFTTPPSERQPM